MGRIFIGFCHCVINIIIKSDDAVSRDIRRVQHEKVAEHLVVISWDAGCLGGIRHDLCEIAVKDQACGDPVHSFQRGIHLTLYLRYELAADLYVAGILLPVDKNQSYSEMYCEQEEKCS